MPLVLDEMHAPAVAQALRKLGHDVVAVAEEPDLRAMTDPELFRWATERGRRVVTENVKDFRPLLRQAVEAGGRAGGGPAADQQPHVPAQPAQPGAVDRRAGLLAAPARCRHEAGGGLAAPAAGSVTLPSMAA